MTTASGLPMLDRYQHWMPSTDWSDRTREQRAKIARRFLQAHPDLRSVTPDDLVIYLAASRNLSGWTRVTYYKDLKTLFRWALSAGHIETDPMVSDLVRRPRAPQGFPKPLTAAEVDRVLAVAAGWTRAYVLLGLRAGLRAHEIAKIRGEDVGERVIYVKGKGGKESAIPTHAEIWELAQHFPSQGYWFPSTHELGQPISPGAVSGKVHKLFRSSAVGIPTGSVHRCRHTYATELLRAGANLRQVQTLMRHGDISTTALYTAVDEDELRIAVRRLGAA